MRAYLRLIFIWALLLMTLTASLNFLVNPYLYFSPAIDIPRFNAHKYLAGIDGFRTWKSQQVIDPKVKTVLFGTSRVMVGLDPHDIPGGGAFNLGLPETNMYELEKIALFLAGLPHLGTVIWGLDLLAFTDRRENHPSYYRSLFAPDSERDSLGLAISAISFTTLGASAATVAMNLADVDTHYMRANGHLPRTTAALPVRTRFDKILSLNFFINPETYAGFRYSEDRLQRLENALNNLRMTRKTVHVFISPIHARQLLAIREMGLWDTYKRWLSDVVGIVARVNARHPDQIIVLHDFSGFNAYTQEDIPTDDRREMRWYFESSHYRHELGKIVLQRLLKQPLANNEENFGKALDPANIADWLTELDTGLNTYIQTHPQEVAAVHRLGQETAPYRQ